MKGVHQHDYCVFLLNCSSPVPVVGNVNGESDLHFQRINLTICRMDWRGDRGKAGMPAGKLFCQSAESSPDL